MDEWGQMGGGDIMKIFWKELLSYGGYKNVYGQSHEIVTFFSLKEVFWQGSYFAMLLITNIQLQDIFSILYSRLWNASG